MEASWNDEDVLSSAEVGLVADVVSEEKITVIVSDLEGTVYIQSV